MDTSDIFSVLNALPSQFFCFFGVISTVSFQHTDNISFQRSLTCWKVDLLSRKQGNGREITQSRHREQGNIVREKTIRAHRNATEIAPGWR